MDKLMELLSVFESSALYQQFLKELPAPLDNPQLDLIIIVLLALFVIRSVYDVVANFFFRKKLNKKQRERERKEEEEKRHRDLYDDYLRFLMMTQLQASGFSYDDFMASSAVPAIEVKAKDVTVVDAVDKTPYEPDTASVADDKKPRTEHKPKGFKMPFKGFEKPFKSEVKEKPSKKSEKSVPKVSTINFSVFDPLHLEKLLDTRVGEDASLPAGAPETLGSLLRIMTGSDLYDCLESFNEFLAIRDGVTIEDIKKVAVEYRRFVVLKEAESYNLVGELKERLEREYRDAIKKAENIVKMLTMQEEEADAFEKKANDAMKDKLLSIMDAYNEELAHGLP